MRKKVSNCPTKKGKSKLKIGVKCGKLKKSRLENKRRL